MAVFTESSISLIDKSAALGSLITEVPITLGKREEYPRNSARCGYISGLQIHPLNCAHSNACRWDRDNYVAGCCSTFYTEQDENGQDKGELQTDCGFFTKCYDLRSSELSLQGEADAIATGSAGTLVCAGETTPYCAMYTFTDVSYSLYTCAETDRTMIAAYDYTSSVPWVEFNAQRLSDGLFEYQGFTAVAPYASSLELCQPSATSPWTTECVADVRAAKKAAAQDHAVIASAAIFMLFYSATILAVLMRRRGQRKNPRWKATKPASDKYDSQLGEGAPAERDEHLLVSRTPKTGLVELSELPQ